MRWFAWFLVGSLALAQPVLRLEQGWVRRVPGNITAAYLTLYNPGDRPIRIVGASSPVATRVEFHETTQGCTGRCERSEISVMRRVDSLLVPARGRLQLIPGKFHLMLYGLREKNPRPLQEGQKVPLTFRLEGGATLTLSLTVQKR